MPPPSLSPYPASLHPLPGLAVAGLHPADLVVVAAYLLIVLAAGPLFSRRVRSGNDFFLAGRRLGRWLQFVLNFGNMTDPDTAVTTASSVYREGMAGIWLGLAPLVITPFYWFMNLWFRRTRLVTTADLFAERFGGRGLASLFAATNIAVTILTIGFANIVAFKTLEPLFAKPEPALTAVEHQMVSDHLEFERLTSRKGELTHSEAPRFDTLWNREKRGELRPFVSYLHSLPFYVGSSLFIAVFIMLGGLEASAVVDALQTTLVVGMSLLLLPFGLARIGGLAGLHARIPAVKFHLFGSNGAGEYNGASIAAFLLMSSVAILAAPGNMNVSGSAKDEFSARFGAVAGGLGKRVMTAAWGFCGLIALAYFGAGMADPDQAWGSLTAALLPTGLVGVMIVGLLGGKLARLGTSSIVVSALAVKNLYTPLVPGRSEGHYLAVARLAVPLVLAAGVAAALALGDAVAVLKFIIAFGVVWGAPILLVFLWRRLTAAAVWTEVLVGIAVFGLLPWIVSASPALTRSPALTLQTPSGTAVYFEGGVARVDPADSHSALEGLGRFDAEVYLVSRLGCDVAGWSPAGLLTARYLVDTLLPLVMLVGVSVCTRRSEPGRLARFYARLRTPVAATPEADAAAVARAEANPALLKEAKLFPQSDWEFARWNRTDTVGFFACCAIGAAMLYGLNVLLRVGS